MSSSVHYHIPVSPPGPPDHTIDNVELRSLSHTGKSTGPPDDTIDNVELRSRQDGLREIRTDPRRDILTEKDMYNYMP